MSQLDRRHVLKLFGALGATAAAPLLSACTAGNDSTAATGGKSIKIGLITPKIGPYKLVGDEIENGFSLFVKYNAYLLGRRAVSMVSVEEGDPLDTVKTNVQRMIETEKPLAITGIASTPVMSLVADLAEKAQIPLIGSNASSSSLQNVLYTWRTSYVNDEPGTVLGKYVGQHAPDPTCIVAANEPGAAAEEISSFVAALKSAGGHVVGDPIMVAFPSINFGGAISRIATSGAASVYCFFTGQMAAGFIKAYRAAGLDLPIYAPGFLTEGTVLGDVGDLARDITTVLNYSPDLFNDQNSRFVVNYAKEYGRLPSTYAMASYDAASVLNKAIVATGSHLNSHTLNAELGKLGVIDSPRGPWQFNAGRTPTQEWYLREVGLDGTVPANITQSRLAVLR